MPLDITINCSCGTSYAFEVEPENGQMPCAVQCPNCGLDGTVAANEILRQQVPAAAASPKPAGLRIRAEVAAPAVAAKPAALAPRNVPAYAGAGAPQAAKKPRRGYGEPNMLLGSVGALIGGIVGMVLWYGMVRYIHIQHGLIAVVVGVIVGVGCRVLGGGYSVKLGLIASLCALLAIVGGKYLAVQAIFDQLIGGKLGAAYEERVEYARGAVQQKSEAEIRVFLAQHPDEDAPAKTAGEVTHKQLEEFRKELPELEALASGKMTRAKWEERVRSELGSLEIRGMVFKESLNLWSIIFAGIGIVSAYRLGTGQDAEG